MTFEKTLFNGIFQTGDQVMLKDLKDVLYTTMATAKQQLEEEVDRNDYYVRGSRAIGKLFIFAGFFLGAFGVITFLDEYEENIWKGIALFVSALFVIFFGFIMGKRTKKGTLALPAIGRL
jgi:hypothetical protein